MLDFVASDYHTLFCWEAEWLWKSFTSRQFNKIWEKTYSEEQDLVNSRYELLTTRQQFCGDISTLFQSHCETRMTMTDDRMTIILVWQSLWNRVEISPLHCCLVVNSSYLEFTRCCSSEYVFSYIEWFTECCFNNIQAFNIRGVQYLSLKNLSRLYWCLDLETIENWCTRRKTFVAQERSTR